MYWLREQVTPGLSEGVCSARILQKLRRGLCFLLDITTWVNVTFWGEESKPAFSEEQRRVAAAAGLNAVWMQRSPFNTPVLTLAQARRYSRCLQRHLCCFLLLHTGVRDNLSTDDICDELILLPLSGLFHDRAAAEVRTGIWSVAVLSVSSHSDLDSQSLQRALLSNLLVKAASPPSHPQSRSLLN